MSRVLILTRAFECGGVSVALINLLKNIDLMKHKVTIECIEKIGESQFQIPDGIEVKEIQFTNNEKYRMFINQRRIKVTDVEKFVNKSCKKICQFLYRKKNSRNRYYEYVLSKTIAENQSYDIVLDFYGYGCFTTAYAAKMVNAKKKIMWLHDEKMEWLDDVNEYLDAYDRFFCVSDTVKKNFKVRFPQYASKAELFYNIVDTEQIIKKSEEEPEDERFQGKYKIVTVGRLAEQKGYDLAVEAAEILKKRGIDFKWFGIGEGIEVDNLNKMIQKYSLQNEFILLGRKNNPYPYIKNCDLYLQPSRHEGYGLSVLEARVLKKVIVASDTECIREQIQDGKNGFLVELNAEKIAEKIIEIIQHPETIRSIMDELNREEYLFTAEKDKLKNILNNTGQE